MMDNVLSIWSPEAAIVTSVAGVFLVQISLVGSTIVKDILRQVSDLKGVTNYKIYAETKVVDSELLEETHHSVLLEFVSTAILFKIIQSVGLSFYLGLIFSIIAYMFKIQLLPSGTEGMFEHLFANIAFFLAIFAALFITIAYSIHRFAQRKLRGLQEWLHLIRLRYFVKC